MSGLDEALFERLYPRYRQTFGEPPPLRAASLDEAVAFMRSRLRAHSCEAAQTLASLPQLQDAQPRPGSAGGHAAA